MGIFRTQTTKNFCSACFTFPRIFSSPPQREKKTKTHTQTQRIIHEHQKFRATNVSLLFVPTRHEPIFKSTKSFYFCFNFGHGEIFEQSIILLLFQPQREPSSKHMSLALLFHFRNWSQIFKRSSFYFCFSTTEETFSTTHPRAPHHHTHTITLLSFSSPPRRSTPSPLSPPSNHEEAV